MFCPLILLPYVKSSIYSIADDNSSTSFDNNESEAVLSDLSTLKPSNMEPRVSIIDKNYAQYKINPKTLRANRDLVIKAGVNMMGFVSQWKQKKKVCVAGPIPKFLKKIMVIFV